MKSNKSVSLVFFTLSVILSCASIYAQTDTEKLQEARRAVEKYKDCEIGREVLGEISAAGQANPLWVFYMAKSYECSETLPDLRGAIEWYGRYDQLVPGQPAIVEKLVKLRAKARSKADEQAKKEKERAGLVADITGLWDPDGSETRVFKITQTGNRVVVVLEMVSSSEYGDYNWRRGDLKFEGTRQGNFITGKLFVRLRKDHSASDCPDKPLRSSVDSVLEVSADGKELDVVYDGFDVDVERSLGPNPGYVCKPVIERYSEAETWVRKN
jgi:hypothetical protein